MLALLESPDTGLRLGQLILHLVGLDLNNDEGDGKQDLYKVILSSLLIEGFSL